MITVSRNVATDATTCTCGRFDCYWCGVEYMDWLDEQLADFDAMPETDEEIRFRIVRDAARRGIRCGHCHGRHESVMAVFACSIMHNTAGVVTA